MLKIKDKFYIKNSKSKSFLSHLDGEVPFISNGTYNNGVIGFVTPQEKERIFVDDAITVSAFGDAIVQKAPFLPRGNGGSGLTVLESIVEMSQEELYSFSAQINAQKWRFSYSRMVTKSRIENLPISEFNDVYSIDKSIRNLIPNSKPKTIPLPTNFTKFKVSDICFVEKSGALPQNQMDEGNTPYVTTSSKNNGVSGYVNEEPNTKSGCLTVSLNGSVGEAFFQFDDFVTSGDNALLKLKNSNDPYLLLFIAFLIRKERWRYNYYRKLTLPKLKFTEIYLPTMNNKEIDKKYIKDIFQNTYGFDVVQKYIPN